MRITLKDSAYALQDPAIGLHFALCRARPCLKPGALGTLFRSAEQATTCASAKLQGIPHELVRLDQVAA